MYRRAPRGKEYKKAGPMALGMSQEHNKVCDNIHTYIVPVSRSLVSLSH